MVNYYFSGLSAELQGQIVNELIEKNKELQQFYDDLMNTEGLMQINTVAKELGIGEYHLFAYLRGKKVFFYDKDKVNVPFTKGNKQMKNLGQLIKKDSDSLIGYKATKRGALVAGGIMMASGVPGAGEQFIKNRQGTNFDQQATTSAPRVPAYANNGGATGDLVFALNNLRHGGMM